MAIPKGHSKNFNTMIRAAKADDLALMECKDAKTGAVVYVVCMVNRESNGDASFAPVAKLFDGNPYEELLPPNPDGGFHEPAPSVLR